MAYMDTTAPLTIANYARGVSDALVQNNPFLSKLKASGNIVHDEVGGDSLEWVVEAGRHSVNVSSPGQDISEHLVPHVRHKRAVLPAFGEILAADTIDRGALRRNTGDQALAKAVDSIVPSMLRDVAYGADNSIAHQILRQNGSTYSGNGLPIFGLPSFLLPPAATGVVGFDGVSTATAIAPADTDIEAIASSTSQTYAGIGLYRSSITGLSNVEADAWTPTLVNTSATAWSGTNDDEANAVEFFLQHGVNRASRFSNTEIASGLFGILAQDMYGWLGKKLAAKQTVHVMNDQKTVMTPNLGYQTKMLRHAGVEWFWDEHMSAGNGFLLNPKWLEILVQKLYQGLESEGSPFKKAGLKDVTGVAAGMIETEITRDPYRRGWLVTATAPLQLRCKCPRYHVRFSAYS